jgi:1,4-alpha-glucan branching enzyme
MPDRKPGPKGTTKVVFNLPPEVGAESAVICGDFNAWSETKHPLRRYKDGHFGVSINLAEGEYRYRFLLDGDRWENDWDADSYVANDYGTEDSLVKV